MDDDVEAYRPTVNNTQHSLAHHATTLTCFDDFNMDHETLKS